MLNVLKKKQFIDIFDISNRFIDFSDISMSTRVKITNHEYYWIINQPLLFTLSIKSLSRFTRFKLFTQFLIHHVLLLHRFLRSFVKLFSWTASVVGTFIRRRFRSVLRHDGSFPRFVYFQRLATAVRHKGSTTVSQVFKV